MRVIGVIDLRGGKAVHARGGNRQLYAPVRVPGRRDADRGDALALARFYLDDAGLRELYVADLDAIDGAQPQRGPIDQLLALGVPVWIDAGIAAPGPAVDAIERGVARIVVGLETLPSVAHLDVVRAAIGGDATVFSLDLRNGQPMSRGVAWPDTAEGIALQAVAAGIGALIVLDVARVGSGSGLDLELIARLRAAAPQLTLVAGGGIAGPGDLAAASAAGCDAVLVASALLDGRLTAADIHQANSSR